MTTSQSNTNSTDFINSWIVSMATVIIALLAQLTFIYNIVDHVKVDLTANIDKVDERINKVDDNFNKLLVTATENSTSLSYIKEQMSPKIE